MHAIIFVLAICMSSRHAWAFKPGFKRWQMQAVNQNLKSALSSTLSSGDSGSFDADAVCKGGQTSSGMTRDDVKPARFSLGCGAEGGDDQCNIFLNVTQDGIAFFGPSAYNQQIRVSWDDGLKRVLMLSKPDEEILPSLGKAIKFLWKKGLIVLVHESIYEYLQKELGKDNKCVENRLEIYDGDRRQGVDLVITFGGDGLLMHCNSMFGGRAMPPIMSFDFGSLGFLCPFYFEDFEKSINSVIDNGCMLTLRMRLECSIWRPDERRDTDTDSTTEAMGGMGMGMGIGGLNSENSGFSQIGSSRHVLNEIVVDRGPASFLSVLDIVCDNKYMTTLQGDGIIIATPTGSTAYSLAAGGSMVHPCVPAILLTPICAHTLSFRPLLLPDSSTLECFVPLDCRAGGWVSFDGKFRQELQKGDCLRVQQSLFPMPTINRANYTIDWFDALRSGFMFNERPRQSSKIPSK